MGGSGTMPAGAQCAIRELSLWVATRKNRHRKAITTTTTPRHWRAITVSCRSGRTLSEPAGDRRGSRKGPRFPFRRSGTINRSWGAYFTLVKGLEAVDGQFSLLVCCYNLQRSVVIGEAYTPPFQTTGATELLQRLRGSISAGIGRAWAFVEAFTAVVAALFGHFTVLLLHKAGSAKFFLAWAGVFARPPVLPH